MAIEETSLWLQWLERNFINIIILFCLIIIMIRGADKIFPKLKKAKIGVSGVEIERDCGEAKEGEEKKDCSNNRSRRSTDVCNMHCKIAEVIETNTKALDELKTVDKKLIEHDEELWIDVLQIQFYMEFLPKSIRMLAGLRYLWWGLNSDMKEAVLKFKNENLEVYKNVIACRPELRIGKYAKGRKPESA